MQGLQQMPWQDWQQAQHQRLRLIPLVLRQVPLLLRGLALQWQRSQRVA